MRIAHISDLHISRRPFLGEFNLKRLLGYGNYLLFRGRRYREHVAMTALDKLAALAPDLVLATGDLTQHGLAGEFDVVAGLLDGFAEKRIPVIAVAGNHDIYGPVSRIAFDALRRRLAPDLRPDRHGIYRFPGVELLVLEQCIVSPPFFSHGRQSREELENAASAWSGEPGGVMRLVAGHYPVVDPHGGIFSFLHGLRKARMLADFCRDHHVAAYFCGHNHKRFVAEMPGGCIQYTAPALSDSRKAAFEWVSVYDCSAGNAHPVEVRNDAAPP